MTNFAPENYNLSINLNRVDRNFDGTVVIKGESFIDDVITLHAKELNIESAHIDGREATWQQGENNEIKFSVGQLPAKDHLITIGFSGEITDAMHGLYPCYFKNEGEKGELLATQFESHHAREVFPCVDEPEAKATFDLTLTTEQDVAVLGNMPVTSQNIEDDLLVTTFGTTPRMSSYLLAWVVGDLHKKTATTKGGVEVNIWATQAQSAESLDFALDHAVKSIDFFDEYFGVAYPLPKSDHVALPDFSSGAMENWGLVTYREVALLADPKTTTVSSKHYIATVISHELSHQWFGNLVTMKWWNDLWLNESFATLMEYVAVDAIHPEWNAWLDFAGHESMAALRRDAVDGVQSVQIDVKHPDEISSIFDPSIVYAKGARLMRMCQAYIGDEAFQTGLRSYFKEFSYKNTEASDLWKHFSQSSGKDISSFMNTWISQSGYPVLNVGPTGLSQNQFFVGQHQPSDKIWPIALNSNNGSLPALLDEPKIDVEISLNDRFNVGDTAHFLTHYSQEHLSTLVKNSQTDLDKLQLLHEQTLLVRGGLSSSDSLIDLLGSFSSSESYNVWEILAVTFSELKKFVEDDKEAEKKLRELAGKLAKTQFARLGWSPTKGESEGDTKLRSNIIGMMTYSQNPDVLAKIDEMFAAGVENIDPELRDIVLSSVVYRSKSVDVVKNLFELHTATNSSDLQQDISAGITSVRKDSQIEYVISQLTDTELIRPQDNARWFAYLIRNRYARSQTWSWVRDQWGWIESQFSGDKSFDNYPRYAAFGLMTDEQRQEFDGFFSPMKKQPALKRVIELGLVEIDARIDLLKRDGDAVCEALKKL